MLKTKKNCLLLSSKSIQSFKLVYWIYLVYQLEVCGGNKPICLPPKVGVEVTYSPRSQTYFTSDTIVFNCKHINEQPVSSTCMSNGQWSTQPPQCQGERDSCSSPQDPQNGVVLCCKEGSLAEDICCDSGHYAQFTCEQGYMLQSITSQWKCISGVWFDVQNKKSSPVLPKCVREQVNPITPASAEISGDMLRTLIGVAVGVLSLLLLVIILAFCKPRLKDIKRRWRDMREDETRLVINGQEVNLPTYDEAILPDQERWIEPVLPLECMLNSLSRPAAAATAATDAERFQHHYFHRDIQSMMTTTNIAPPISNSSSSSTSDSLLLAYDDQQPCCSNVSRDDQRSVIDNSRIVIDCHQLTNTRSPATTTSSSSSRYSPAPTASCHLHEEDELCLLHTSTSSSSSSSHALVDAGTTVVGCDSSVNNDNDDDDGDDGGHACGHSGFDDNFVDPSSSSSIEVALCSPSDKIEQSNISFFSVLSPDIQLDTRLNEERRNNIDNNQADVGTEPTNKTKTKWTRF